MDTASFTCAFGGVRQMRGKKDVSSWCGKRLSESCRFLPLVALPLAQENDQLGVPCGNEPLDITAVRRKAEPVTRWRSTRSECTMSSAATNDKQLTKSGLRQTGRHKKLAAAAPQKRSSAASAAYPFGKFGNQIHDAHELALISALPD